MKSIFCGIILFAVTGCASPEISIDYTLDEMIWAPWLRIQVAPTFEPPEEYEVNRHDPHMLVYKVYSGSGGYDWGKAHKILRISLTTEQHDKVKELADKVLTEFPLRDEVIGFDGTTWILESSIYQYTKLSVWTPEHQTEKRGYGALLELREYMHGFVDSHQPRNN